MPKKLKIINKKILKDIYGFTENNDKSYAESKNVTYISSNPIIRYIWWRRLENLLKFTKYRRSNNVLDLGCGEGVFLPTLSRNYTHVDATDIDITTAISLKEHFSLDNVNLINDNICDSKLKNNSYDLIFAASILEHLKNLSDVLNTIKRILKKDGLLIYSVPSENVMYKFGKFITGYHKYTHPAHQHHNSRKEIYEMVVKKFKLVKKSNTTLFFFSLHNCYCFKKY